MNYYVNNEIQGSNPYESSQKNNLLKEELSGEKSFERLSWLAQEAYSLVAKETFDKQDETT